MATVSYGTVPGAEARRSGAGNARAGAIALASLALMAAAVAVATAGGRSGMLQAVPVGQELYEVRLAPLFCHV